MTKVYISSAMTGKPNYNTEAFFAKAKELQKRGLTVLNPAENSVKYGFNKSYGFYMREAIKMLLEADVMLVFGDWKDSKGVAYERQIAALCEIPIVIEYL